MSVREIVTGRAFVGENGGEIRYVELSGASSDTKPVDGIANGSIFTESDTGDVYFFDEATTAWVKQFSFQG